LSTINNKMLIPSAIIIVLLAFASNSSSSTSAQNTTSYTPIVQKIAQKFNLNENDVEEVFIQDRMDLWNKRKQQLSDKLGMAVNDGKISQQQKQMILNKKDELQADRFAELETRKEEMKLWMNEIGVNPDLLVSYLG
jgi:hypothetical protein